MKHSNYIISDSMFIDTIIAGAITGIGTGLGAAIGTYLAQKGLISNIEKLDKRILIILKKRK